MKKTILTIVACLLLGFAYAENILFEGFEYANHEMQVPVGWTSDDASWVCGYLEQDLNHKPHSGNWYAFSDADDAWMFMQFSLFTRMQYRFTCWAIADGEFQLEFWAGTEANPESMHTQLLSATVSSDYYEKYSAYVDTIPAGCQYIAIHAVAGTGATHLCIDDIGIDMLEQYTFEAEAITGDTAMFPGTEATFRFLIHNTGYDPVDVTVHPSNEFFTNFSFEHEGTVGNTFPTQPDEVLEVTAHATLRPEVEPGTVAWLDVQMTIPCNCNTAMVTFWVTPLDPTGIEEDNNLSVNIFPNPTTDFVTIEAEGLQCVSVFDASGRMTKSVPATGNALHLDLTDLKAGTYFISAKTCSTSSFVKSILKM